MLVGDIPLGRIVAATVAVLVPFGHDHARQKPVVVGDRIILQRRGDEVVAADRGAPEREGRGGAGRADRATGDGQRTVPVSGLDADDTAIAALCWKVQSVTVTGPAAGARRYTLPWTRESWTLAAIRL